MRRGARRKSRRSAKSPCSIGSTSPACEAGLSALATDGLGSHHRSGSRCVLRDPFRPVGNGNAEPVVEAFGPRSPGVTRPRVATSPIRGRRSSARRFRALRGRPRPGVRPLNSERAGAERGRADCRETAWSTRLRARPRRGCTANLGRTFQVSAPCPGPRSRWRYGPIRFGRTEDPIE